MAYDESNVFAKVLRGEIPCHRIYEDEDTLAFLDIMPRSEGHALVITKEKARDLSDISPQALAKLMAVVQKLAPKIKEAVGAEGVLIQQFNGAAAGQTVFHLHIHIIPRKEGEPLKPHAGKIDDQTKLAATAEKIRKKLAQALNPENRPLGLRCRERGETAARASISCRAGLWARGSCQRSGCGRSGTCAGCP